MKSSLFSPVLIIRLFLIGTVFSLSSSVVYAGSVGPVLVISDISGDEDAFSGYPYHGSITLENQGDQTSGVTKVIVFLKNSDTEKSYTIYSDLIDPIRPKEARTLDFVGTADEEITPGKYYLHGYLPESSIREFDNTKTLPRNVHPVLLTPKDLPDKDVLLQDIITAISNQTNEQRMVSGISSLEWDDSLAEIADGYAKEISGSTFLSHTDSSGRGPSERAEEAGYPTTKEIEGGVRIGISENLAYIGTGMVAGVGYVDPTDPTAIARALMDGWMKSPGHRENILDPLSDRFGVGIFYHDGYYYAVSNFW